MPRLSIATKRKHGKMVRSRLAPCRYAQMHLVTGHKILAGPFEYKMTLAASPSFV